MATTALSSLELEQSGTGIKSFCRPDLQARSVRGAEMCKETWWGSAIVDLQLDHFTHWISGEGIRKKCKEPNVIRVLNSLGIFFFGMLGVKSRSFFSVHRKCEILFSPKNCNYTYTLAFLIKILTFTRHTLCKNDSEKLNAFIVCCGFKYLGYVGILLIEWSLNHLS